MGWEEVIVEAAQQANAAAQPDKPRLDDLAVLMDALVAHARAADVHVVMAGICSSNTGSIALHERLGFVTVGVLPEVGRKFDRWLDLTLMQLRIA